MLERNLYIHNSFAYFHLFIYILPYLTHTRRIEERFVPPIVWDYCDFTATAFPLRLRLTPRTAASSYQPSTHYRVFLLNFLLNFYCIASHCAPHIVTSQIETVYWKGLTRPRTFYIDLSVVFVLIIFRSYRHCGRITAHFYHLCSGRQEDLDVDAWLFCVMRRCEVRNVI